MTFCSTPSICHVNLNALERNFRKFGDPARLMPVIKSDAYGHGMLPVAERLAALGALRFAVGTVSEGIELRRKGFNQDLYLLLGCMGRDEWELAARHDLTPLVSSFDDLTLAGSAVSDNKPLKIAIKCDTGMSRLGFGVGDWPLLLERLSLMKGINPQMLVSHLACADMPEEEDFTTRQIEIFDSFYRSLAATFPHIGRSLGNSAAILRKKTGVDDISRPGIALYGGNPIIGEGDDLRLEWVMSVSAPVIHVRNLEAGQSVSYGRTFIAPGPMRIAVLGIGYANGINRRLSNNFEFLLGGRRVKTIGRVCMGMTMADISHATDVKIGDRGWILGGVDKEGRPGATPQEMASQLGTIPYEILCLLGGLNPRVYNAN